MPKTTQLTLTLQSKPGVLAKVARALADAGVNITALSAGDRSSSGKLRIVVNNPGRAKRALRAAKLRANEEPGAETGEPRDVGLDVSGVEAEVLEAVMRHRIAGAELLVGAGARDVDGEAVLAGAAHEAVTEHARLVADDLEAERGHVPLGGLAGIRRLQVDVVDAVAHGRLLVGGECAP